MKKLIIVFLFVSNVVLAQKPSFPPAKVSFDDFKTLAIEVEPYRNKRLINLDTFLKMSKKENVIILDTRSNFRFNRKHLKGAVNLAFTDFTQKNLLKLIPDTSTTILIYCNNNFEDDEIDFASKMVLPKSNQAQFKAQEKPIMLALNIPTYINLYGYGYRNIFELAELVNVKDPRITFRGTVIKKNK